MLPYILVLGPSLLSADARNYVRFEGVCVTHVILAPGVCGRVALSGGFGSLPREPVTRWAPLACSGDLNL